MEFASARVITDDIKRLVKFYEDVTGLAPTWYSADFAELATPGSTLAIGSTSTMAMFGAGAARSAENYSAIIEFRLDDVDGEYRKLKTMISDVVQEPTTMPWGNRSLLFRDPDGNLINFLHTGERGGHQEIRPLKDRLLASAGHESRVGRERFKWGVNAPNWRKSSILLKAPFFWRLFLGLRIAVEAQAPLMHVRRRR